MGPHLLALASAGGGGVPPRVKSWKPEIFPVLMKIR
jgi:hypothetical protein